MSERQKFRVITDGKRLSSVTEQDLVQGLMHEFSLSSEKAKALCTPSIRPKTLKKGLSAEQAHFLKDKLRKIGLNTHIIAHSGHLKAPLPQKSPAYDKLSPSTPLPKEQIVFTLKSEDEASPSPSRKKTINAPLTSVEKEKPLVKRESPSWQTMDSLREIPLRFSGKGGEFINLWHRHWFLSLLSFGFFWPWAQVRQQRYLWSRLSIDGVAFDYLGTAWPLFWTQLSIVLAALLLGVWFFPLELPLQVMGTIISCVVMAASIRFRFFYHLRHLTFGGVRLHWFGLRGYAKVYLLLAPVFSVITLGVLTPYSVYVIHSDQINRICIGRTFAQFDGALSDYFDCGFRTLAWVIAILLGIGVVLAVFNWQFWWLGALCGLLVLWVAVLYLRQQYFILALKSTDVDGVGFDMPSHVFSMLGGAGDLVAIVVTLGLAAPWVRFKRWKIYCDHLQFLYAGSLSEWIKGVNEKKAH